MKHTLISILLILICFTSDAQQYTNYVQIDESKNITMPFDSSRYDEQNFYFDGLFKKTIRRKKERNPCEEFIRYSDTSFLYIQYDSLNRVIGEGLLAMNRNKSTSDVEIMPDLDKDPTMEKGIMKEGIGYTYAADKILYWIETDKFRVTAQGMYVHGERDGIWEKGYYMYPGWVEKVFVITDILRYSEGKEEPGYRPDYSLQTIWSTLKGEWWFDISSVNEQYMLTKKQPSFSSRHKFDFIDSVYIEKSDASGSRKLKWKLKDNIITIHDAKIEKFRIAYISPDLQLYLTPINN
jgi:hypothetical protein